MPKRSLLGPETYITRPKEKETSIEEVLQDAQNIDFSQQDDHSSVAEFSKQHAARLTKVHTQTVDGELLHVLAKDRKKTLQHEKFLIWTLKKHPNLLGCLTNAGNTPLHTALENKNDDMVELILTHTADQPKKVLFKAETKGGEHCLHSAINYNSRYTRDLIHLGVCYQSEVKIFDKMTHDDRDTPLSLAVQQEEDSSAVVDKLSVASSRTTHLAPPSWPLKNIDKLSSEDRPRDNSRNRQGLAGLSRKDTVEFKLTAADDRRDRPPPVAIAHAPETQKPASSTRSSPLQIVQDLVDAMPAALYQYRDKWGNTPYQARILHLERERRQRAPDALTADTPKINPQELVKQDDIARFIRSYCIRRLPRRDALTALYTVGEDLQIDFDLSGLPLVTIDTNYLDRLSQVLRFESILSYVALPRLSVEEGSPTPPVPESQRKPQEQGKGSRSLANIFRWLKKHGVESIIRVVVIDDTDPPHSDEAIEECLDGLKVEVWNWKKIDLCTDVIAKVALETVREVPLYSSGNNAVLLGWSSADGLARFPNLEKVHLYVREGLESPTRLEEYMKLFEHRLRQGKPDKPKLEFNWTTDSTKESHASGFREKLTSMTKRNPWLELMTHFGEFLRSASPAMEHIKIAVIDDGIDIGLDIFNDKIGAGDSFLVLDEVYGKREGAYYVPSGSHGTLMAHLICTVCPVVKLYVAQLETVDRSDGRRSFTSESATDAINWAVDRDVDIISMSWSINSNRELTHLNDAIGRAEKNQIIMLCSAIDQGSHVRDNTYPGKNKNCIKIRASTVTGERLGWVSKDACDFLLPGENVSLPRKRSSSSSQSGPTTYPQAGPYGSSVSTALAAGLAGVLLYCERLLTGPAPEAGTTSSPTSDPVLPYRNQLRGLGQMKVAFDNLAKGGDDKFIQVADHFREEFKNMVWNERDAEKTDDTRRKLQQLMATIVNNSTVTSSRLWNV